MFKLVFQPFPRRVILCQKPIKLPSIFYFWKIFNVLSPPITHCLTYAVQVAWIEVGCVMFFSKFAQFGLWNSKNSSIDAVYFIPWAQSCVTKQKVSKSFQKAPFSIRFFSRTQINYIQLLKCLLQISNTTLCTHKLGLRMYSSSEQRDFRMIRVRRFWEQHKNWLGLHNQALLTLDLEFCYPESC